MVLKSGIETKAQTLACQDGHAQGRLKGSRRYAVSPALPSPFVLLGRTHHRNGDCGCEPAHQLTVAARTGEIGREFLHVAERRTPLRPLRGGVCYWTLNC